MGAVILRRNRVLLVERGREPLKGFWSLPGGVLEIGEALEDAIRREVLEETGLEITPFSIVEVFERILRDGEGKPEYHYVLIDYLCRITGGELRPGDDVSRCEWVAARDLPTYKLTEGSQAVIEKALQIRDNLRYL
ncbi:MAG: NUDIX hydrolase [Acidobacteria bacterium]|nr:NUDIX hydrolase [Acidobacteriota bacterium]